MKATLLLLLMSFLPASCEEMLFSKKNNARYIMEANTRELIIVLAGENSNKAYFNEALHTTDSLKTLRKNYRYSDMFFRVLKSYGKNTLQNTFINKQALSSNVPTNEEAIIDFVEEQINTCTNRVLEVIKKRIAYTNGKNALIEKINGSDKIRVDMYTEDPVRTGMYLKTFGKIELLYVYEYEKITVPFLKADEYLAQKMPVSVEKDDDLLTETNEKGKPILNTQSPLTSLLNNQAYGFYYPLKDTATIGKLIRQAEVKQFFPTEVYFIWTRPSPKDTILELIPILKSGISYQSVTGDFITEAHFVVGENNGFEIVFSMNTAGAIRWKNMTRFASESNPKKRIAIVLDNVCITAPVVQGEIPNGSSSITGNYTRNEAMDLASILNAGAYPMSLSLLQYEAIK